MSQISIEVQKWNSEIKSLTEELYQVKPHVKIGKESFDQLFPLVATAELRKRGSVDNFIVDNNNQDVINQLYLYFTMNDKFSGSLSKGILLLGNYGTGKTIIIRSFISLIQSYSNKRIAIIHSKSLPEMIEKSGLEQFGKKPMFIDDIGKEPKTMKIFGTEIQPMIDLLTMRYDNGSYTLATGNNTLESYEEFYGKTISERMKEMFNVVTLLGKSRRK